MWQRPQHLLARVAKRHPVFFVEEPRFEPEARHAQLVEERDAGVTILTPVLPEGPDCSPGFNHANNAAIAKLLTAYFENALHMNDVIAWYYTPMALGALPTNCSAVVTVFDAMDELSKFRGAPQVLKDRERELIKRSDLLFAGGPSLYRERRTRHQDAYCFPSGVDANHFRTDKQECPDDIAHVPSPIIGFYGVLDERINLDLVAAIADARPLWSMVMIGPVVKISESDLPRRPNIHYPGMRRYDELPWYLAQFNAAILPFALNEATQFISPTKSLEYLAGEKPVVSTPISDVIELYGDVIEFASDADAFVEAIERLWAETPAERDIRSTRTKQLLAEHDWDLIATSMLTLIHRKLEPRSPLGRQQKAAASLPYHNRSALASLFHEGTD